MTLSQFKNQLNRSTATKEDVVVPSKDAEALLEVIEDYKINKAVVQSIVSLMMVEDMDDDKLIDTIAETLVKANLITNVKAGPKNG